MPSFVVEINGVKYRVDGAADEAQARERAQAQHAAQKPVDFDAGKMVSNIPGSAKRYGKDIAEAAMSPIDTAGNLGKLGISAVNKLISGLTEVVTGKEVPQALLNTEAADAVGEFYGERYGGMDAFKKTLMEDPVGVLADLSAVVTGGGSAVAKIPGLTKIGKTVQTAGRAMEPLNVAAAPLQGGLRQAVRAMPEGVEQRWYQSAAKFPPSMAAEKREYITNTLLDEGVLPNRRGAEIVAARIDTLNTQLDEMIEGAQATGKRIPVGKVFQYIEGLKRQKGGFKAEGTRDLKQIDQVIMNALDTLEGRKTVSPRELQDFKVDLYDKIYQRKTSGSGVKRKGTKTQAQSTVARGAKDAISEAIPETADINRQLSGLYTARAPLERAVNRLENANKISIRGPLNVGAGGALTAATSNPLPILAGIASWVVDNPQVKGRLARGIRNARKGDIGAVEKVMKGTTEIRLALALAERSDEELAQIGLE